MLSSVELQQVQERGAQGGGLVADSKAERLSDAYFMCPSWDSPVGTCAEPWLYKSFTFGEYMRMVQDDVT